MPCDIPSGTGGSAGLFGGFGKDRTHPRRHCSFRSAFKEDEVPLLFFLVKKYCALP